MTVAGLVLPSCLTSNFADKEAGEPDDPVPRSLKDENFSPPADGIPASGIFATLWFAQIVSVISVYLLNLGLNVQTAWTSRDPTSFRAHNYPTMLNTNSIFLRQ